MSADNLQARITAALRALAAGDAMGRATEHYRPAEIVDLYEDVVAEFLQPVRLFDDEPWQAGEIGPPTGMVLAQAPGGDGAAAFWSRDADAVERLPAALAPGLLWPLDRLLDGSEAPREPAQACVAIALATALTGAQVSEVIGYSIRAAELAGDAVLAAGIGRATGLAQASGGRRTGEALAAEFPPSGDVRMIVPFILGLVYATQSARRAILEAVNQGGHAPETAGIAGAVCAAAAPASLPGAWGTEIERANDIDLEAQARRFVAARGQ
jgi:ADP-ribosylglycohydrolase